MNTKIILSIAGSDSGGGAGIQADIKTISAFKDYACTAITAITAQNTMGVKAVYPVSGEALSMQLNAIGEDLEVAAVKIGMVPNEEHIAIIAEAICKYSWKNIVLDPVMVATSGDILVKDSVVTTLVKTLFPLCTLITPNIPEAEVLSGERIEKKEDMLKAAYSLLAQGPSAVLIKGGHLDMENMIDILALNVETNAFREYSSRKIETSNLHGTGCTLSSAIAVHLAHSEPLSIAVEKAKTYITNAIISGTKQIVGHGNGPVDHFLKSF